MENNISNINDSSKEKSKNFIYEIIDEDLKTNKWNGIVHTRFPPEPNGYLHIDTQNLFVSITELLAITKGNLI